MIYLLLKENRVDLPCKRIALLNLMWRDDFYRGVPQLRCIPQRDNVPHVGNISVVVVVDVVDGYGVVGLLGTIHFNKLALIAKVFTLTADNATQRVYSRT